MSEWFPQVVSIERIEKHTAADTLSIAYVLNDYPVVIKTGQYQVGDLVGYLPVDTIVPDTDQFYFLCPKAYENYDEGGEIKSRQLGPKFTVGSVPEKYRRIKAKRFMGVFSMGMLVSVPQTTGGQPVVGTSIVEMFELKKYEEPEEEDNIVSLKMRGANAASPPKGWAIPHYDIDGLRKYASCILPDEQVVLTEKLNGSNAAFCHDGSQLWAKSRNWYKKQDEDDPWWDIALRLDLASRLDKYPLVVMFGELVGNVKNFRYTAEVVAGRLQTKMYFFDAYDVQRGRYLGYDDFMAIVHDLGLDATPELYRGPWKGKEEMYPFAEGKSILNPKVIREGFVLRPVVERFEPRMNGRFQLKLISEAYSLQK